MSIPNSFLQPESKKTNNENLPSFNGLPQLKSTGVTLKDRIDIVEGSEAFAWSPRPSIFNSNAFKSNSFKMKLVANSSNSSLSCSVAIAAPAIPATIPAAAAIPCPF